MLIIIIDRPARRLSEITITCEDMPLQALKPGVQEVLQRSGLDFLYGCLHDARGLLAARRRRRRHLCVHGDDVCFQRVYRRIVRVNGLAVWRQARCSSPEELSEVTC